MIRPGRYERSGTVLPGRDAYRVSPKLACHGIRMWAAGSADICDNVCGDRRSHLQTNWACGDIRYMDNGGPRPASDYSTEIETSFSTEIETSFEQSSSDSEASGSETDLPELIPEIIPWDDRYDPAPSLKPCASYGCV